MMRRPDYPGRTGIRPGTPLLWHDETRDQLPTWGIDVRSLVAQGGRGADILEVLGDPSIDFSLTDLPDTKILLIKDILNRQAFCS